MITTMLIRDLLLPEFDAEMANTRKVLERVPEDKLSFQPHPKSFTLGKLATHVATLPTFTSVTLGTDALDVAGFTPPPNATSRAGLLAQFDKLRDEARAALAKTDDAAFLAPWSLRNGAQVIFTMNRLAVLRSFAMNHLIHHRAQLTVYLRLLDVPLPGLYGPSADEN